MDENTKPTDTQIVPAQQAAIQPAPSTHMAARKQRSTPQEVMHILKPMFAMFPQLAIGPETIAGYVDHLMDIPPQDLAAAVHQAIDSCEFLPSVAVIRKIYQDGRMPGPRNDLTLDEIAARPAIGMRIYRDPDDTPEGRRKRLQRSGNGR